MFTLPIRLKASSLVLRGHACAQDPQDAIVTLGVGHDDHATFDRADGDEAILFVGMFLIIDL